MDAEAHRHINTSSDSELLLNIFANNLQQTGKFRINEEDIFTAIRGVMTEAKGAYACVAMLAGFGIIAFRDPCGIRPVGMAERVSADGGKDYLFASESVVADAAGFTRWEDVKAGAPSSFLTLTGSRIETRHRRGDHHHPIGRSSSPDRQSLDDNSSKTRRLRPTSSNTSTSRVLILSWTG